MVSSPPSGSKAAGPTASGHKFFIPSFCRRGCKPTAPSKRISGVTAWHDHHHSIADPSEFWRTNMGEVIRFVSKAELERAPLIREARERYDSIFPPADSENEQRNAKNELAES